MFIGAIERLKYYCNKMKMKKNSCSYNEEMEIKLTRLKKLANEKKTKN